MLQPKCLMFMPGKPGQEGVWPSISTTSISALNTRDELKMVGHCREDHSN